jgi:hypothetical protein
VEEIVSGIDAFGKTFVPFADEFIVIGGSACRAVLQDIAIRPPRKTADIDMVLVPQQLSDGFIGAFWRFIKEGGYKFATRRNPEGDLRYVFYSFVEGKEGYPERIELLSKPDDSIGTPAEHHIEYIETGEDYSHLSAIILDSDFFDYVANHFENVEGIRYASADALVCLKALAYVNLAKQKRSGGHVNSDDLKKHRRDVMMALSSLTADAQYIVGARIRETLDEFLQLIADDPSRQSLKASLEINDETLDGLLRVLQEAFVLEQA